MEMVRDCRFRFVLAVFSIMLRDVGQSYSGQDCVKNKSNSSST